MAEKKNAPAPLFRSSIVPVKKAASLLGKLIGKNILSPYAYIDKDGIAWGFGGASMTVVKLNVMTEDRNLNAIYDKDALKSAASSGTLSGGKAPTPESTDFLNLVESDLSPLCTVKADTLKTAAMFAATDERRPIYTGIHLKDGKVEALDGYRLYSGNCVVSNAGEVTVPASGVALLPKDADVRVHVGKKWTALESEGIIVYQKRLEGVWLDTSKAIPDDTAMHITADRKELTNAVKTASAVLDKNSPLVLRSSGDRLELIPGNKTDYAADVTVESTADVLMGLNPKYLLDALKATEGEDSVTLMLHGDTAEAAAKSPVTIRSENALAMVLPMRIAAVPAEREKPVSKPAAEKKTAKKSPAKKTEKKPAPKKQEKSKAEPVVEEKAEEKAEPVVINLADINDENAAEYMESMLLILGQSKHNREMIMCAGASAGVFTPVDVLHFLTDGTMPNYHTFDAWKEMGLRVKKGAKAAFSAKVWKHRVKNEGSFTAEEAERLNGMMAGAGEVREGDPKQSEHFILKTAFFFGENDVEEITYEAEPIDLDNLPEGVTMERKGREISLNGDTKPYKESIKAAGFRWSKRNSNWYKYAA